MTKKEIKFRLDMGDLLRNAKIAIIGAQGPMSICDERDPHFMANYWRLIYGFDHNLTNHSTHHFVGLKYDDLTRHMSFQPIDVFHRRISSRSSTEVIERLCHKIRMRLISPSVKHFYDITLLIRQCDVGLSRNPTNVIS